MLKELPSICWTCLLMTNSKNSTQTGFSKKRGNSLLMKLRNPVANLAPAWQNPVSKHCSQNQSLSTAGLSSFFMSTLFPGKLSPNPFPLQVSMGPNLSPLWTTSDLNYAAEPTREDGWQGGIHLGVGGGG